MSLDTILSADEKAKIKNTIVEAVRVKQEIADLTEGLKDVVTHVAEETGVPKKELNKAISIAFKAREDHKAYENAQEELDTVGQLLEIAEI